MIRSVLTICLLLVIFLAKSQEVNLNTSDQGKSGKSETVTDVDGNVYSVVEIGTQKWMGSNLKTTKFANGDVLTNATSNADWDAQYASPLWCNYDNNASHDADYGKLYNYAAVKDTRNVCPTGWHVPTKEEWTTLCDYLGGAATASPKLKESGTAHWASPNTDANNESGFTALPGGYRDGGGDFVGLTYYGNYWTSSSYNNSEFYSYIASLHYSSTDVYFSDYSVGSGMSIRCIKNQDVAAPVAAFTADVTSGTAPLTVQFTDQSTNSPTAWSWAFGDGGTSTSQNPSHTYTSAGTYTVSLTVSNGGGSDTETKTDYITVTAPVEVPTVTTANVSGISQNSAVSGGNVTADGGAPVTARGVCWSTSANPTINDSKTEDGQGTGEFTSNLTGLTANTIYYVRAYATNSAGTGYGGQVTFTTLEEFPGETVADIEGNVYPVVAIGTQKWMGRNLKTTKYNDNTPIDYPETDNSAWTSTTAGAYAWYNNDINNKAVYGALYNWFAVETGKLCPSGWHVPSDNDWKILEAYLGVPEAELNNTGARGTNQGGMLKETGTDHWNAPNTGATNSTGFSAVGHGVRYSSNGNFAEKPYFGYFWTSTPGSYYTNAVTRGLSYDSEKINRYDISGKNDGRAVRCLKDAEIIAPVAAFTADVTSGTAPLTVQFTDQSTNGPTAWNWAFGDGATSTDQNPSHTYSVAGTYTVTLTATNAGGSDAETKAGYIVVGTSQTYASLPLIEDFENTWIDKDGTRDVPSAYWINSPATGQSSWRRDDDGQASAGWGSLGGAYTPAGVNGSAHSARFHSFGASINDAGTMDLHVDFSTLTGDKILSFWYINTSGSDKLEVTWSFDGGQNFSSPLFDLSTTTDWQQNIISLGTSNSNQVIIRFKATSDWGMTDIGLDRVIIDIPSVAAFTADVTSGNAPLTVQFTDQSTNTPRFWNWDFGDGSSSSAQNPLHTYANPGTYTVSLTVGSAAETVTKTDYITVTAPVEVPTVTTANVSSISQNTATSGGNVTADGGAPVTARGVCWSTSANPTISDSKTEDGTGMGSFTSNITGLTANTTYYVRAYATNSAGTGYGEQITFTTLVNPPVAAFTADVTSGTAPLTVQFTDQSSNGPTSWSWAFGDGATSTDQNPSHTYTTAGTYTVSLTVSNGGGSDTQTKTDYITITASNQTFASLPFNEGFENTWINKDNTRDVPSVYWKNNPATGSNSWSRDDDGVARGAWTSNNGMYTPSGANGSSHSARFNSYNAPNNYMGTLDLHIDFSTLSGEKKLKFAHINPNGADFLEVFVSTDGGSSFGSALATIYSEANWTDHLLSIGAGSQNQVVIRFRATSDFGNSDIGIDDVAIGLFTSVESNGLNNTEVFPNPFNGKITVQSAVSIKRITINNVIGQQVMAIDTYGTQHYSIATEPLRIGVYLITLEDIYGNRKTVKMVKK
jgi:uncharacterized protein (TIGR02145 family)